MVPDPQQLALGIPRISEAEKPAAPRQRRAAVPHARRACRRFPSPPSSAALPSVWGARPMPPPPIPGLSPAQVAIKPRVGCEGPSTGPPLRRARGQAAGGVQLPPGRCGARLASRAQRAPRQLLVAVGQTASPCAAQRAPTPPAPRPRPGQVQRPPSALGTPAARTLPVPYLDPLLLGSWFGCPV